MAQGTRPSLEVEQRDERGTRATKRLRQEGWVPGVVYGGEDCVSFKVNNRVLRAALVDGSALIDLKIGGGKARPVIIKDQQRHPVRGHVMHIDLLEVRLDEKIGSTVAIELEGVEDAPGVKEGGVLEHVTRELNVEALPTEVPDRIVADVSGLGIAETMTLSSVRAPAGVELLDDLEETVVATVTAPTKVEEPEPEVEEEAELVGEGEAPAEGEEAPAAEGGEEGSSEGGDEG
jgi:large subunit ribosomal protein L25